MGQNMTQATSKSLDNFAVIRGGQYAKRRTQTAVQEQVYGALIERRRGGRKVFRSLKNVLCGRTNPGGEVVKLIYRLRAAGISPEHARAIAIEPLERELEEAFALKPAA